VICDDLADLIGKYRYPFDDEAMLQEKIAEVLALNGVEAVREVRKKRGAK